MAQSAMMEWAVASRTFAGELESGDLHLVAETRKGVLVAVMDGLGHGSEAATASQTAATVLEDNASGSLADLMHRCHEKLRGTRGVALSLAFFHAETNSMSWLGVGNVEGVLFHSSPEARPARESLVLRGGVVGYQLPTLRITTSPISHGDTVIFTSDGIKSCISDIPMAERPPQDIANEILRRYGKDTDDALALVLRYEGSPG